MPRLHGDGERDDPRTNSGTSGSGTSSRTCAVTSPPGSRQRSDEHAILRPPGVGANPWSPSARVTAAEASRAPSSDDGAVTNARAASREAPSTANVAACTRPTVSTR